MNKTLICVASLAMSCLLAAAAPAQVIDGIRDAAYGSPIVLQTVNTQFGDSNGVYGAGYAPGSELDAAYARVDTNTGRLNLFLAGNHESNFNKLEIFIDSVAGGENTLSATPDYDFFNGSIWTSSNLAGLTFDTGFEADYHLFSRWGGGGEPGAYEVDFVNRQGGTNAMVPGSAGVGDVQVGIRTSTGSIAAGSVGPNASGTALTQSLDFAILDSNALGVVGGDTAACPVCTSEVGTGMEFSVALADIGNPGPGDIVKISAMINGSDHNFLSNQILGGLMPPQGNLGGDGGGGFIGDLSGVDFNQFGGLQYFEVVVPEPGSLSLIGLGMLAVLGLRRR